MLDIVYYDGARTRRPQREPTMTTILATLVVVWVLEALVSVTSSGDE